MPVCHEVHVLVSWWNRVKVVVVLEVDQIQHTPQLLLFCVGAYRETRPLKMCPSTRAPALRIDLKTQGLLAVMALSVMTQGFHQILQQLENALGLPLVLAQLRFG